MGSVWRVWDSRENRIVAAKVLRQSDAVSLLRFVREQAVRVAHPHVLTPLGWAGEDDRVLFTMPVVDGGSVSTLVGDHGALPPRFAAELLRQLLDALVAVHGAGIVHRDIKPANLLLRATGADRPHLYLTDFGIAVDLEGPRFTRTGGPSGTPGYIAPETRAGAEPDPRSDLYAVGRVALTMLAGERLPVDTVPPCPPGVPEPLWQWAARLAAPDADARPASATEAAAALADPALAWAPGAAGDVEVLRQVAEVPGTAQLVAHDDSTVVRTPPLAPPPGPDGPPWRVPASSPSWPSPASSPGPPGRARRPSPARPPRPRPRWPPPRPPPRRRRAPPRRRREPPAGSASAPWSRGSGSRASSPTSGCARRRPRASPSCAACATTAATPGTRPRADRPCGGAARGAPRPRRGRPRRRPRPTAAARIPRHRTAGPRRPVASTTSARP